MGSIRYEEKYNKIRISEFARFFGERCRQIAPTPYLKSKIGAFHNVFMTKLQEANKINTPTIDLSIFKDYAKQKLPHNLILELIDKLSRGGINNRTSDFLYQYFSKERPKEITDYSANFCLRIRSKREITDEQFGSPRRIVKHNQRGSMVL